MRNILSDLLEHEIPSRETILDIGVGQDPPSCELSNPRIGCDIFQPALKATPKVQERLLLDAKQTLPFKDKSFDTVLALDIIEHLPDGYGEQLIAEAERVAKKRVIFYTPNGFLPQDGNENQTLKRECNTWQKHLSEYSERFFQQHGFRTRLVTGDNQHSIPYTAVFAVKTLQKLPSQPDKGLVSIVIPTRNRPHFLKDAIESALGQTYPRLEVIVVDDGSDTEETAKLCEQYRVQYIRKPKGGTASAINLGIRKMHGEWFKWLSDDDYLEPTALENLLKPENPIVYSEYFVVNTEKVLSYRFSEPDFPRWEEFAFALWDHHIGNACATIIHKDIIDQVGLFNENLPMHEDYEYWLRMFVKHRMTFHLIHKVTVNYRRHQKMLTLTQQFNALKLNDNIRKSVAATLAPSFWGTFNKLQREYNKKHRGSLIRYYGRKLPEPLRKSALSMWRAVH